MVAIQLCFFRLFRSQGISRAQLLSLTLLLAAVFMARGAAWAQSAGAEWTTPAGTAEGTRFSSLKQIDTSNVGSLIEEFHFTTGVLAGHEGQPLVVGSTMYVVGPFPNKLFALDLTHPGKTRWVFDPNANAFAKGQACCDVVNKGAAFANGRIIYNALDNTTVAVDAASGKQVWRTKLGDPRTGQTMTMAPLVVRDKVFVGNSGAELGVRGWIAALDVNTGRELWRAWSTGPDTDVRIKNVQNGGRFKPFYAKDRGPNLGTSTWPGTLWKQGGGTVWAWLTYDSKLNLLFHGAANPGTWNPDIRPGDNKWSSTIFARDPDTGEAVWAYQLTPHDSWDFDAVNENILVDLPFNNATRQVLVHFNKNGFAYTMDRATGEVLVAKPFIFQNWTNGVFDFTSGLPGVVAAKTPHEGVVTKDICPALPGGKDMEPAAFSPDTGFFYVPAINLCMDMEPLKVNFIQGTPYIGASSTMFAGRPLTGGKPGDRGELIAWDAVAGKSKWTIPETFPLYGGALATAGNLVFYGTADGNFKAVNATTGGQALFQVHLPSGIVGNPIAFTGPDGKQRIAIYSGIGGGVGAVVDGHLATDDAFAAFGFVGGTADLVNFTAPGGAVYVFKLP